jgi:hypothetical protein
VFDDTEVSFGVSGVLLIGLGIADEVGFFISGFWAGCSGVSVPTGATLLFNDPVKVSSEFTASISRVSKVESVLSLAFSVTELAPADGIPALNVAVFAIIVITAGSWIIPAI